MSAPLLPVAVCWMTGIWAGDWAESPQWPMAVLLPLVVVTWFLRRLRMWQTAGIYTCVLLLGMTYSAMRRQSMNVVWADAQQKVEAVVVDEPVVRERTVMADVLTVHTPRKLRCRIARDERSERLSIGQGLLMTARITPVHQWETGHFNYRHYMRSHGFSGECFVGQRHWEICQPVFSEWTVVQRVRLRLLCWRHALLQKYQQWGLAGDAYSVVAAMTLGSRTGMSTTLSDVYNRAGVSHILALSGMHLTVVYMVIALAIGWWRWRMLQVVLTVASLWIFAFLVGLSPSVVRAAFMMSVYGLLALSHRGRMSVNVLSFTALVMTAVSPFAIYDVGFQLSFMAVLSILLLNPLAMRAMPPHVRQRHWLAGMVFGWLMVSLSAQVGTAPLVAYYFGRLPTYFLLANIVAVPLAAVIIFLTLASVLAFWWTALQRLLVGALTALVTLLNRMLNIIAAWPQSSIEGISLNAVQVVCIYVLMGCGCFFAYMVMRKKGKNFVV